MWTHLSALDPALEGHLRGVLRGPRVGAWGEGGGEGLEGLEERARWLAGRVTALEVPLRAAIEERAVRARLCHAEWEGAPPPGAPPARYWVELSLSGGAPRVLSPAEHIALALLDPALSRAIGDALDEG